MTDYHSNTTHKSRSQLAVALDSWRTYEGMYVTGKCPPVDETIAMQIGSFTHQQILEPHLMSMIQIIPEIALSNGAKRGNVWKEYKAANEGKVLLKKDEYDDAMGCVESIRNHLAGIIFSPMAEREVEIYWTHHTGLKLRAKLDLLLKAKRHWIIPDIKTTADLDRFPSEIRNRNLWLQPAHYRAAVKAEFGEDAVFKFVPVEKSGVYRVREYELDHDATMEADERYENLLVVLAARHESGDWSEKQESLGSVMVGCKQCFKRDYSEEVYQ